MLVLFVCVFLCAHFHVLRIHRGKRTFSCALAFLRTYSHLLTCVSVEDDLAWPPGLRRLFSQTSPAPPRLHRILLVTMTRGNRVPKDAAILHLFFQLRDLANYIFTSLRLGMWHTVPCSRSFTLRHGQHRFCCWCFPWPGISSVTDVKL